jgi:Zn-dependent protease with chaperone function
MFLPFIPHLLALAGITALLSLAPTPPVETATGGALALVYLALLLLGGLVGQLPPRWVGPYRANSLSRRRFILMAAWFWLLTLTPLPQALVDLMQPLGAGQEGAILLLLLNFWISDALSLYPYQPLDLPRWRVQGHRLLQALRLPLPILLLVALGLLVPPLAERWGIDWMARDPALAWLQPLGALAAMLLIAALAIPLLIRLCWGLKPLASAITERAVREELAANGVSVARVLGWPEEMMGSATAGVIGLVPRFRYLLFSESLARALTPEEIRSVTAHEAGHLKHHHLWYFLAAIVGFIVLLEAAMTALFWAGVLVGLSLPVWGYVAVEVAGLLLFLRLGIGYLSRHFERQADGNALRRLGLPAFASAIAKVGIINGIPPRQDNWHHYGIARRVDFLRQATDSPDALRRHDRKVRRIKVALLVGLVACMGAQAAVSQPDALLSLTERYVAAGAEDAGPLSSAQLRVFKLLAYQALERDDLTGAERYFRRILSAAPEDPRVQNNLAWILVTRPDPDAAQLAEGLRLAKAAVRASSSAYIWDTLAEAYYRLKQFDLAASAADRALRLAEDGVGRGEAPLDYYRQRVRTFKRSHRGA